MQLGEYFTTDEMQCKDGCGFGSEVDHYDPLLIEEANVARELTGRPWVVKSGARCAKHNAAEGGVKDSAHMPHPARDMRCCAIDVQAIGGEQKWETVVAFILGGLVVSGRISQAEAVIMFAEAREHASGIGVANSFVHVDSDRFGVKPRPGVWTYK